MNCQDTISELPSSSVQIQDAFVNHPNKHDRAESEESNDMVLNFPDIERVDKKRGMSEEEKLALRLKRLEEKKAIEEAAALKRKEKAIKGMKYLLTLSEKYAEFFRKKVDESQK